MRDPVTLRDILPEALRYAASLSASTGLSMSDAISPRPLICCLNMDSIPTREHLRERLSRTLLSIPRRCFLLSSEQKDRG